MADANEIRIIAVFRQREQWTSHKRPTSNSALCEHTQISKWNHRHWHNTHTAKPYKQTLLKQICNLCVSAGIEHECFGRPRSATMIVIETLSFLCQLPAKKEKKNYYIKRTSCNKDMGV